MQETTKSRIEQIKAFKIHEAVICFITFCLICGIATLQSEIFIGDKTYPKWICLYLLVFTCTCFLVYKVIKKELFISKLELSAFCLYLTLMLYLWLRGANTETIISIVSTFILYLFFKLCSKAIYNTINNAIIASSLFSIGYSLIMLINGDTQIKGTYENNNSLCILLVYSAIILLNKYSAHNIYKGLLTLNIIAIICTFSRTGILAMAFCFCLNFRKKIVYCILIIGIFICASTNFKKESTLGRLFIYQTTIAMFDTPKNLIFGYGHDGFRKYYMAHQANALTSADTTTQQRADNIQHPLNDLLLLTINYGIIATALVASLIGILLKNIKLGIWQLYYFCTIVTFSMFGYPFNYPITWVIIAYTLAFANKQRASQTFSWPIRIIAILSGIIISAVAFSRVYHFYTWNQAMHFAYFGMVEQAKKKYEQSEVNLSDYPEFNYNYAHFLLTIGQTQKALKKITVCHINNYDTQMLAGDICSELGNYPLAIRHYTYAEQMCPNRFLPLFAKFQIHEKSNEKNKLRNLGNEILSKSIKVPSIKIDNIKQQVKIKLV